MNNSLSVRQEDPTSEAAAQMIRELTAELFERYQDLGLDGAGSFAPGDSLVPRSAFVVARLGDRPVGCGALRSLDEDTVEIKRMYVAADVRRRGIAAAIVAELERLAAEFGHRAVRLETGDRQREAVAFYEKLNFQHIPRFGGYVDRDFSICFEKVLSLPPT